MRKKQKEELIGVFSEAFQDVVMPVLEDMHHDISQLKGDVQGLKGDVQGLKEDMEDVQTTLRRIETHQDHQSAKLDNHEKRITKLEQKGIIA